jgi:hypothetical protein
METLTHIVMAAGVGSVTAIILTLAVLFFTGRKAATDEIADIDQLVLEHEQAIELHRRLTEYLTEEKNLDIGPTGNYL